METSTAMDAGSSADTSAQTTQQHDAQTSNPVSNDTAQTAPDQGANDQTGNKPVQDQQRRLGQADLDALVETKINGKVEYVPLRKVIANAQIKASQDRTLQEQAQKAKEWEIRDQMLKANPREYLRKYGQHDPVKLAEETLEQLLAEAEMSPEQRELAKLREEKESAVKERDEYMSKQQEQEKAEQLGKQTEALKIQIFEAWKGSGLPPSPYFGTRIAFVMQQAISQAENNPALKDFTMQQAAAIVKDEFTKDLQHILGSLEVKQVHDVLGKNLLKKLNAAEIEKVTQKAAQNLQNQGAGSTVTPRNKELPVLNEIEWAAEVRRRNGM